MSTAPMCLYGHERVHRVRGIRRCGSRGCEGFHRRWPNWAASVLRQIRKHIPALATTPTHDGAAAHQEEA